MANRVLLEKEIKEYCKLNNINDVAGFITQCLLQGFNIYRYGVSPQDNIKREKNEVEVSVTNREKKQKKEKPPIQEDSTIKITKRKIKVISND